MTSTTSQNFKEIWLCLYLRPPNPKFSFGKKHISMGILRPITLWYNVMDNKVKLRCPMTSGECYLCGFLSHPITSGITSHDMWRIVIHTIRHSHATCHIHNTIYIDWFHGTMKICTPNCLMWYKTNLLRVEMHVGLRAGLDYATGRSVHCQVEHHVRDKFAIPLLYGIDNFMISFLHIHNHW